LATFPILLFHIQQRILPSAKAVILAI